MSRFLLGADWDDAPHISDDAKASLNAEANASTASGSNRPEPSIWSSIVPASQLLMSSPPLGFSAFTQPSS